MKRLILILFSVLTCLSLFSCGSKAPEATFVPDFEQMKNICELASTECYFHNVAKFTDAERMQFLWIKKDAHFWIEYTGKVTVGIDVTKLKIDAEGTNVTITLPPAKILGSEIVELNKGNYIVDKTSAKITAEDEINALAEAQSIMVSKAKENTLLLSTAEENTKKLLASYVNSIGKAFGVEYTITWRYTDSDVSTSDTVTDAPTDEK